MSQKRTTLRDVAREAGVSYQTVSRVINNHENVSPKTRTRVMRAIDKLDFRVNRAAQIMQTKRSNTIEAILFYTGFNMFLYEMARASQEIGYHFVISAITEDEFEKTLEDAASRFVDGLILIPDRPMQDDYETLLKMCHGIPFVQVGARLGATIPSVLYDQKQGGRLATEHLVQLGHERIAEISGPLNNHDGFDRHQGWLEIMKAHGLNTDLSIEGDYSLDGGYRAMTELLRKDAKFTAVFIGNDSMAIGAHTALREAGLYSPDDVSIVSFDDIPEATHFIPALTTVKQDFQLLGRLAVEYLVSMIGNPHPAIHQRVLQPELIIRDSARALKK